MNFSASSQRSGALLSLILLSVMVLFFQNCGSERLGSGSLINASQTVSMESKVIDIQAALNDMNPLRVGSQDSYSSSVISLSDRLLITISVSSGRALEMQFIYPKDQTGIYSTNFFASLHTKLLSMASTANEDLVRIDVEFRRLTASYELVLSTSSRPQKLVISIQPMEAHWRAEFKDESQILLAYFLFQDLVAINRNPNLITPQPPTPQPPTPQPPTPQPPTPQPPTQTAPVFITHPSSQLVYVGYVINLFAKANDAASFQWKKDGIEIPGATSSSYIVNQAALNHAGVYTVDAVDASGTLRVPSNPATVTVKAPSSPQITVQPPPAITVSPGGNLSISVTAVGDPSPTNYEWMKNGVPINALSSNTYTKFSVSEADAGNYSVKVTNAAGSVTSDVSVVTVANVPKAPVITASVASPLRLLGGQSLSLWISADGVPRPTYTWSFNGNIVSTSASYTKVASLTDSGIYTVTATNSSGSVSANIEVIVEKKHPTPTLQTDLTSIRALKANDFLEFICYDATRGDYDWPLGRPIANISGSLNPTAFVSGILKVKEVLVQGNRFKMFGDEDLGVTGNGSLSSAGSLFNGQTWYFTPGTNQILEIVNGSVVFKYTAGVTDYTNSQPLMRPDTVTSVTITNDPTQPAGNTSIAMSKKGVNVFLGAFKNPSNSCVFKITP